MRNESDRQCHSFCQCYTRARTLVEYYVQWKTPNTRSIDQDPSSSCFFQQFCVSAREERQCANLFRLPPSAVVCSGGGSGNFPIDGLRLEGRERECLFPSMSAIAANGALYSTVYTAVTTWRYNGMWRVQKRASEIRNVPSEIIVI